MPSTPTSYGEYVEAARRSIDTSTPSRYERWYQEYVRSSEASWGMQVDRATSGPEVHVVAPDPEPVHLSPGMVWEYSERRLDPNLVIPRESIVSLEEELGLSEAASEPRPSGWSVRPVCRPRAQEVCHTKGVSPFKLLAIKESEINGDKSSV